MLRDPPSPLNLHKGIKTKLLKNLTSFNSYKTLGGSHTSGFLGVKKTQNKCYFSTIH
jgi:hypothetical protein